MASNFIHPLHQTSHKLYNSQQKISMLGLNSYAHPETSKDIKFDTSDYGLRTQQCISDLSLLIYEGLDNARRQVQNQRLVAVMEKIYKKQLELQIQQCKQMQDITSMLLLNQRQNEFKKKILLLETQILDLKKQLNQIQFKDNGYQPYEDQKCKQINKIKSLKQKYINMKIIKNTKKSQSFYQDFQQNKNIRSNKNVCDKSAQRNNLYLRKFQCQLTQNFSTTESRPSSSLTHQPLKNCTYFNNGIQYKNSKNNLILKRREIALNQFQLSSTNIGCKINMILSQIQILKKQILLLDQSIRRKDSIINNKRIYVTPIQRRNQEKFEQNLKRNPRLKSQGTNRKSKSPIYNRNKLSRPSMFRNNKPVKVSPLNRCHTQYKFRLQFTNGLKNQEAHSPQERQEKSTVEKQDNRKKNEYFLQFGTQRTTIKSEYPSKLKNVYKK